MHQECGNAPRFKLINGVVDSIYSKIQNHNYLTPLYQQDKLFRGEAGGETPRSIVLVTDGLRFAAGLALARDFCGSSLLLLLSFM